MIPSISISKALKKIPISIKNGCFPLSKINTGDFEGIQRGITLFDEGGKVVSIDDIDFITKRLETVNLFRGCKVGCTHCLKDAKCLPENSRSILFEDLMRFTEGFKQLNERFEFNTLEGNKYINIIDDSNPTDFPIRGLTRQHSVSEAIKLVFENLKLPVLFVTSGWDKNSKFAQKSAEKLAKQFTQTPQSLKSVEVSVNPFSQIMENSRKAIKANDEESAKFYRNTYIDRMANTITTFFDLFRGQNPKGKLIYRHANDFRGNELVGEEETRKLYFEIYEKIRKILGDKIKEAPTLHPAAVTKFEKSHLIEPSGRARRYFPYDYNMKLQEELISEFEKWNSMTATEKRRFLRDFSIKCVDINGKVYSTFPANNTHFENIPIELTVPTRIKLNYSNTQTTKPVFSDIELE